MRRVYRFINGPEDTMFHWLDDSLITVTFAHAPGEVYTRRTLETRIKGVEVFWEYYALDAVSDFDVLVHMFGPPLPASALFLSS